MRAWALVAWLLSGCAHCPNGKPCWDADRDFSMAPDGDAAQHLAATEAQRSSENDRELRKSMCNIAWTDEVKGTHCRPLIAQHCQAQCPGPALPDCESGDGRLVVNKRCWEASLPKFRELAPSCAHLVFSTTGTGALEFPPP